MARDPRTRTLTPPAAPEETFDWGGSAPALSEAWEESGGQVADLGPAIPEPHLDRGLIGEGGMGTVHAVWDPRFERRLALKLMRPRLAAAEGARARFLREARTTAGLAHPGIVAVHERGELSDGRLWFTMKEVRGQTLDRLVRAGRSSTRRLLETFLRVCEAMAYAHSRDVIHRDLKPSNIMVGEFGEVLVLDWGLARHLARDDEEEVVLDGDEPVAERLTGVGAVLGTARYMAPEQARSEALGAQADVWALGAMLFEMLTGGFPARRASPAYTALDLAMLGRPLDWSGTPPVDAELRGLVDAATAADPLDRPADAGVIAESIRSWLEGARRRERALRVLEKARQLGPRILERRSRAQRRREEAGARLAQLDPTAPVADKRGAWELEDLAQADLQGAAVDEALFQQTARSALELDPQLPEAHALLSAYYRERLEEAEARRDSAEAARFAELLRSHDLDGQHRAFLEGHGSVSLQTEPVGARVAALRLTPVDRRLEPTERRDLGRTPISSLSLPRGSWILELSHPGQETVRYPVFLERLTHWDGRGPEGEVLPVALPEAGSIGLDEVLVPAGWFWAGGDPEAPDGLPRTRAWLDSFVIQRTPVTVREWQTWLEALQQEGELDELRRRLPRSRSTGDAVGIDLVDGALVRVPDQSGRHWRDEDPVVSVSWQDATAYAAHLSERDGRSDRRTAWRLPRELEWEKAARGVDGRLWPWGDHLDPNWCHYSESMGDGWRLMGVGEQAQDVGPYGVLGMAGNVRDWCREGWSPTATLDEQGGVVDVPPADELRMVRGGNASSSGALTRLASRMVGRQDATYGGVGLRLVRSLD